MSNGTEKLYQTNQIDSTPDVDRDYEYQRQKDKSIFVFDNVNYLRY